MSGFCICLFKMNGNGVFFFFLVACLFVKMLTVLVYRDDTHNIINCLNKRLYLLSKTLIEINILYFSLTSNTLMSKIVTLYKRAGPVHNRRLFSLKMEV